MGVQFGKWNFNGQPVDRELFTQVSELTAKYAPDGASVGFRSTVGMLYRPFCITNDSSLETQPLINPAGVMLTWDGRLDNRAELLQQLDLDVHKTHTDADIVMAAYERWSPDCFSKLIGDWALAIWDPIEHCLFLAKDFIGVRHLYYLLEAKCVSWSTVMDPLVLLAGRPFKISEEYIAGYLSVNPATHLTPYLGINAVPAGKFVRVTKGEVSAHRYWEFDPEKQTRYRADAEYEEHFRSVFAQAVRRRLRSAHPVLAELSGGMDSSSIVCMADLVIAKGTAECPRLDTISYYDDTEPNWDERPYFTLVERKRGREGHHLNLGISNTDSFLKQPEGELFFPLPGSHQLSVEKGREFHQCLQSTQSRVLLSGIGGDEFLGGVPTPIPELRDLFVRMHWVRMGQQLSKWSFQKRLPWLHLLFKSLEGFSPQFICRIYEKPNCAPWLTREFAKRNGPTFHADFQRTRLTGALPSFQANVITLNHLRRQLNSSTLSPIGCCRVCYPYLDRDLLAFVFSVPREQLLRPGQRRSLMRRSLNGITPDEIMTRKRKAYISRKPLVLIESAFARIEALLQSPVTVAYEWTDGKMLSSTLAAAKHGQIEHLLPLLNLLKLELWLQGLSFRSLLTSSAPTQSSVLDEGHVGKHEAFVT